MPNAYPPAAGAQQLNIDRIASPLGELLLVLDGDELVALFRSISRGRSRHRPRFPS